MQTWRFEFCGKCHRVEEKQFPDLSKKSQFITEEMFQDALTFENEGNTMHCNVWHWEAVMLQEIGIISHTLAKT